MEVYIFVKTLKLFIMTTEELKNKLADPFIKYLNYNYWEQGHDVYICKLTGNIQDIDSIILEWHHEY